MQEKRKPKIQGMSPFLRELKNGYYSPYLNNSDPNDSDTRGLSALYYAIRYCSQRDALNLIKAGAQTNFYFTQNNIYSNLLLLALACNKSQVALEILKNPDIEVNFENSQSVTALHQCILSGANPQVLEILMEKGARVKPEYFALAIGSYQWSILKQLVKMSDTHALQNNHPLFLLAKQKKYVEAFENILNNCQGRGELDITDSFGRTPLYYAIESNNYKLVLSFLKYGADTTQIIEGQSLYRRLEPLIESVSHLLSTTNEPSLLTLRFDLSSAQKHLLLQKDKVQLEEQIVHKSSDVVKLKI